jgi:hypothetical protein
MLSWQKKVLISFNLIGCLSCACIAFYFLLLPTIAKSIYSVEYKEKMFGCDSAMRNHLIAKNRVKFEKSKESLRKLDMAEVGLVHCHDYDILRKKMISMGLSPNNLALISLEAIEAKAADIDELVVTHEFKY